jgi:hypothetical protein
VFLAHPKWGTFSGNSGARIAARDLLLRAHEEWEKGFAALTTRTSEIKGHFADRRAASSGQTIPSGRFTPQATPEPPISTPFSLASAAPASPNLFAIDDLENAEVVAKTFKQLAQSLQSETVVQLNPDASYPFFRAPRVNLSRFFTTPMAPRGYLPSRFDRGFFASSAWPDPSFGGVLPSAGQDEANELGISAWGMQTTTVEPYEFRILAGNPRRSGYIDSDGTTPLFGEIRGIAVDKDGNIFIADQGNHVIRKITTDNRIYTVAGQPWRTYRERRKLEDKYETHGSPQRYPSIFDWNLGPLAVGPDGTVYFANRYRISKLSPSGALSDLAGGYEWSRSPIDGTGAQASFDYIEAITVDALGNVYVCDNSAIRKITPAGVVTTLAGKLRVGDDWDTDGYVDGPGNQARFSYPRGIAADKSGVLYVLDSYNHCIRKVQPDGTTSTFVGMKGATTWSFDAKGTKARLGYTNSLAIGEEGQLYFYDGPLIRKVYPDGNVRTIGGDLFSAGLAEGVGQNARFGKGGVEGITVDRRGTVYVALDRCIFEADSVVNPPSAPLFATPTPLPTPVPTPSPSPDLSPAPAELFSLTLDATTLDLDSGPKDLSFRAETSGTIRDLSLNFSNNSSSSSTYIYSDWYSSGIHPLLFGKRYFSEFTRPGQWTLTSVNYYDHLNNWKSIDGNELLNLLGSPISFTVLNSNPDTTPPVLHKLEILDTEANTSNSSAKIRYRFEVSDDWSGFNYLSLSLRPVSGWSWSNTHYSPNIVALDGNRTTYEGTIEIPQGSQDGDWVIGSISLQDMAGNSVDYGSWNNTIPEDLAELKITTGPNFTNPPAPEDKYHPWVVGFEIEPEAVDVSSADQKVTIRVRVNNDNLPTSTSISADLRKLNQDNNWRDELGIGDFRLASGTVANGVYEAELVVPKNYKSGNYTLDSLHVYESGNYNGTWTSKSWNRYSSNIPVEFRKSLRVSGTADSEAPELKSLTLSNSTLDTRNGSATFSATLQITDDMVGLMGDSNSWDEGGAIGFSSPNGVGYAWSQIRRANRISGTSSNGTYQVWFQLPQHSEEGAWTIDYIELIDRNYNTRFLIPANLTTQQLAASTIQVQGWPRGWEQQTLATAATTKVNATIQLANLSHTYNGSEKVPTVSTTPGNLTQNVTLTYNGTTTAPTEVGNYTVVAFLNDPNYQGRKVATLSISAPPAAASINNGGGSAPPGGGSPAAAKSKNGSGNKSGSSAKKSNSGSASKASSGSKKSSANKSSGGSSKKSSASKSSGGSKSGGKKAKKK